MNEPTPASKQARNKPDWRRLGNHFHDDPNAEHDCQEGEVELAAEAIARKWTGKHANYLSISHHSHDATQGLGDQRDPPGQPIELQ